MKKVLVTGAAGSIGIYVIKRLLSEGKYEITALDLKNKRTQKRLRKYQRRINVVYGDINDTVLVEALVKGHDVIIHLAGVMPPLGEFSKKIMELNDYNGTETIIKAINYYNKNCHLIYASTTSMYQGAEAKVDTKIDVNNLTNYALAKYNIENLIKKKLNYYTILRIPLVLNEIKREPFMYNIRKYQKNIATDGKKVKELNTIEVTTNVDAASAFVKCIDKLNVVNKKTFNVGMGENGRISSKKVLKNILNNYGISANYVLSRTFLDKNYTSPILLDSDELDNIINYRIDTLTNYNNRLKRIGKKRVIQKWIGKIIK